MSDLTGYTDTIQTISLTALPRHTTYGLLALLTFLHPSGIDEDFLIEAAARSHAHEELDFLKNKTLLRTAQGSGLDGSLTRGANGCLQLTDHKALRVAIMNGLTATERTAYHNIVVKLLIGSFPDRCSEDQGHYFESWEQCEKCVCHVMHLSEVPTRYQMLLRPSDLQLYCELLIRTSWYLYEREEYDDGRKLALECLEILFPDQWSLHFASAIDLLGLIDLDLNKPAEALKYFDRANRIREEVAPSTEALRAFGLVNVALAHTELGNLDKAQEVHEKALEIRLRINSDRVGNSYSNMSSLLLRRGCPDEAEEMLKRCPSLKEFTDETFINTGNPRFSGDMVLLSRIRVQQGRMDDALRLASKALAFRQKLLGNRLKICDSLYDVASLLHREGKSASSVNLLNELISIAEILPEGEGQLARALFKLAIIKKGMERADDDYESLKARALLLRQKLRPTDTGPFSFDDENEGKFSELCVWMLW